MAQSPLVTRPALALLIGLLVLFGIAVFVTQMRSDGDTADLAMLNFPPFSIDEDRLHQERQDHHPTVDVDHVQEEIDQLLSLTREANLSQFPDHQSEYDPEELLAEILFITDDILPATGPAGFARVGGPLFEGCAQGLSEVLEAIGAGDLSTEDAATAPPADRFLGYRRSCGNLLPILLQAQLITEDGAWTDDYGPALAEVFQRYRWADLVDSRYTTIRQLAPYDLEIFARWRIEDSRAFTPEERLQFLHRSRTPAYLPDDYDIPLARARIRAELVGPEEAFAELVENHPDVPLYDSLYRATR